MTSCARQLRPILSRRRAASRRSFSTGPQRDAGARPCGRLVFAPGRFGAVALPFLCALLAAPLADAQLAYGFPTSQRTPVGSGEVDVAADNNSLAPSGGYFLVPVYLQNRALRPHRVKLSFEAVGVGRGTAAKKSVELAPGERRTVYLPVPAHQTHGQLVATGEGITDGGRVYIYAGQVVRPQRGVLLLGAPSELERIAGTGPSASPSVHVVPVVPEHAPEELAAYVGWDAVVLPDLERLSEAQRRAVEAYAASGGSLFLASSSGANGKLPLLDGAKAGRHDYGFGHVHLCEELDENCRALLHQAVTSGEAAVAPRGNLPPWMRHDRPEDGLLLPQAVAPVGRFLFIIVLFTLAIGPGSVVVARRKGPSALLFTIPATALVTCLVIVGYSVFKEGFTVHVATRGMTLLDAERHRAVTVGVAAYYANVAPSGASFPKAVALLAPDRRAEPQGMEIDWTNGARIGPGFVPSRSYREWGIVAVEPTRARLSAKRQGDGWVVQNALGTHLRKAHLRLDGQSWSVRDVPDGSEARAVPMTMAEPIPDLSVNEHGSRFGRRPFEVAKAALDDGEFLAHVAGPGPLPMGGVRVSPADSEHLVRGEVQR